MQTVHVHVDVYVHVRVFMEAYDLRSALDIEKEALKVTG